jgi:TonB family protein
MSLSIIALEQREKEAKALRYFIIYSLAGSVVIHIGVLALNLGNLLTKFPQVKDEPIEVAIIETPNQEVGKLPEINAGGGGGGSKSNQLQAANNKSDFISIIKQSTVKSTQRSLPAGGTPSSQINLQPTASPIQKLVKTLKNPPQQTTPIQPPKPFETTAPVVSEPTITPTSSIQKLVETLKNPLAQQITPIQPSKSVVRVADSPTSTAPNPAGTQQSTSEQSGVGNAVGNGSGNGVGNGSGNGVGNGSGNGVGNGSGNGVGNGSGNGIGNGSGNGIGNGSGNGISNQPKKEDLTIAVAPKPPTDNSSKLDRTDCLKCEIKYPNRARQRGIEGNPEVAVDTDVNGNVTRVRLIHSSGDSELDEAAQRAAQEWKLKPTSVGRQGIRASINFAMQGSQRHRELQARQRREAEQKKTETSASILIPEFSRPSPRSTTGVVVDVPIKNTARQNQESAPTPQAPRKPQESDTPSQSEERRTERVQRRHRQLENILRRQQPSQSQEGKPEGVQIRRKKLVETLRLHRRQQPPEPASDASVPASTTLNDSNINSINSN